MRNLTAVSGKIELIVTPLSLKRKILRGQGIVAKRGQRLQAEIPPVPACVVEQRSFSGVRTLSLG